MRVIAIEEHFVTAQGFALQERLGRVGAPIRMWAERLGDLGDRRLADMDAAGIDVQVLSTPAIGVEELDPAESVSMSKELNDVLAKAVADHPDRFAGFAVLPTLDAAAAADELDRAVTQLAFKGALINGHTRGRFLDDQEFWPIFERAEHLEVPIYLHPTPPPPQVREAYYSGLPGMVGKRPRAGRLGLALRDRSACAPLGPRRRLRPLPEAPGDHRPHGREHPVLARPSR